jgi:electron transport complex protein RnfB
MADSKMEPPEERAEEKPAEEPSRRDFIRQGFMGACFLGLGAAAVSLVKDGASERTVWQLDPNKCIQCGKCASRCVLKESAVKCVHGFGLCGYCDRCMAYFQPLPNDWNTGAENQLCPLGAIQRKLVEDPYYEFTINEKLCIGCGKCVKGCSSFGNGSLFLQVRQDRCLNCNDCSIAAACPAQAYKRVPASQPYLLKEGSIRS